MKRQFFLCSYMVFMILSCLFAQAQDVQEIVSIKKNVKNMQKIRGLSLDLLMEHAGRIYIHAAPREIELLKARRIPYRVETETLKIPVIDHPTILSQGGVNGDYHSYSELEQELRNLEESSPHLARVVSIGKSLENRDLYALKISDNVSIDEDEAEVLILGCHHGREWISVEVPFYFGKYMLDNYTNQAEIQRIVNQSEIWIIPLVNPDGLEYSIHVYRYWRKNRRNNQDGTFGVDLNRNYGYNWGMDDSGSSPEPGSSVYRGPYPFSEPETQAVRNFFLQKNFQALVSYHNYSQLILYPWGYTKSPSEKEALLNELAGSMAALMYEVNQRLYEYGQAGNSLYLSNGSTTDWSLGISGIPSFTIELPPIDRLHGAFFNSEEDIQSITDENIPALLHLIDWVIKNKSAF